MKPPVIPKVAKTLVGVDAARVAQAGVVTSVGGGVIDARKKIPVSLSVS
jgi:hypothetical protein